MSLFEFPAQPRWRLKVFDMLLAILLLPRSSPSARRGAGGGEGGGGSRERKKKADRSVEVVEAASPKLASLSG
jgi:hypothetical protein